MSGLSPSGNVNALPPGCIYPDKSGAAARLRQEPGGVMVTGEADERQVGVDRIVCRRRVPLAVLGMVPPSLTALNLWPPPSVQSQPTIAELAGAGGRNGAGGIGSA